MRFHQSPPVPYYQKILIIPVVLVLGILIVHPNTSKISTNKSSKIPFIPLPMCDPDGRCHENPTIPSPRTIYSSFSKTQEKLWQNVHETLKQTSKDYVNRRNIHDIVMTKPLLLLGDSITESWLGTSYGRTAKRTAGIPKVLEAFTYPSWDPLVLAVSGDQTQHLLYRLQDGEIPLEVSLDDKTEFILMIGTNNLGSGMLPNATADGVEAVADYILANTKGHVLLLELLPRGDAQNTNRICPPRCQSNGEPFKSFMPAIEKVNSAIRQMIIPRLRKKYGKHRVKSIDCGSNFLEENEVQMRLMPDKLHPNAEGHKILAQCIFDQIND